MQSSGLDAKLYKKIEDDINRKLFSQINTLSFIRLIGEVIEEHLNQILVLRELSEQWLDFMDLPTRDDIADIAKKIIENEERLDRLDEILHQSLVEIKENRNEMSKFAWVLAELDREMEIERVKT